MKTNSTDRDGRKISYVDFDPFSPSPPRQTWWRPAYTTVAVILGSIALALVLAIW